MSADSTIFERIHLPNDSFDTHMLNWLQPLHAKESLESYINRFYKLIKHHNQPILIGVSFGGIIAQELAKKIPSAKVILVSSIKHHSEQRPFFKFVKNTQLYKLYPPSFINWLEKVFYQLGSKKIKRTIEVYRKFLPIRNSLYTKWAIHTFLNWKQTKDQNIIHIHGNKDRVLPIKHISNCIEIKNGSHAMIVTKSSSIQQLLLKYMA